MKNIFKYLAVAAMSVALTGLVACDPEPKPEPEPAPDTTPSNYEESGSYAIQYHGDVLTAGQTINYYPTEEEFTNDLANFKFYINNKTDGNLSTCLKIEKMAGDDVMDNIMICFGETCKSGVCPWISDPFNLVPGVNENLPIKFSYSPSLVTSTTKYRFTIGKGTDLEDPQVMILNATAQAQ